MINFNERILHELAYKNGTNFVLYSNCSILLNNALITIMFGNETIFPSFECCYYFDKKGTYFGLNEMREIDRNEMYIFKYITNYSILLDDILISIFEIKPVGKSKINLYINNFDFRELTYYTPQKLTNNYFTKNFYRIIK